MKNVTGVAIIGVLLAETKLSNRGLGFMVIDSYAHFDMPAMYATIGFVFLVSVVFFMSLERIERWLRPGQ